MPGSLVEDHRCIDGAAFGDKPWAILELVHGRIVGRFQSLMNSGAWVPPFIEQLTGIDNRKGFESLRLSFIVNRPKNEPGFEIMRTNGPDRQIHYGIRAYSANRPEGERYED